MRMKIHLGHGLVWLAGMGLASSALAAHVKSHGYATTQAVASVHAASGADSVSGAHKAKPFSVNAASEPQWEALKGIGPKRAQAIVAYRKAHGPFKQPADVAQVKGVSASALVRIAKVNHVRFEVHPA
jgi:competence protein ComEA